MGEYTSHQPAQYSVMNQLINNFKKPVERKNRKNEWHYKEQEIEKIAKMFLATPSWEKLKIYTWIPIPPSKTKNDPNYDDRLLCILKKLKEVEKFLDVRELLLSKINRDPAHIPGGKRLTTTEHCDNFLLDESLKDPNPNKIIIFDDIITTGASFKAAQITLKQTFPNTPIIGIFIARSIRL